MCEEGVFVGYSSACRGSGGGYLCVWGAPVLGAPVLGERHHTFAFLARMEPDDSIPKPACIRNTM